MSAVLVVLGLRAAIQPTPPDDFDGALNQVQELIDAGDFETAATRLRDAIEPALDEATPMQRGWFHALSGELTFASQAAAGVNEESNHQHVVAQFAAARELGYELGPRRIEWWGETQLAMNDPDGALERLAELKPGPPPAADPSPESHEDDPHPAPAHADSDADAAAAARAAYTRLFRHIIEHNLAQPDFSYAALMQRLAEYRTEADLDSRQQLWLAARMAELRLESEEAAAAIAGLLVDMRRLEGTSAESDPGFGELYALLGRGHQMLGDDRAALPSLTRALAMLAPTEPARGDVLVMLAAFDERSGELESAFEKVNRVVTDFAGTHSHLPALLARAEFNGILGDHHGSQADYREVVRLLAASKPRRDINAASVAASLVDRYDASVALGRLERALDYLAIAERAFDAEHVPAEVLLRLASVHRQLADNLLSAATPTVGGGGFEGGGEEEHADPLAMTHVDPALRHEANAHYASAGEYYLRHAAVAGADPVAGDDGASRWAAADSFDTGGRHDRAIELFEQYLANRPSDDARRPETLFRLAQAHQARLEYEAAAARYRSIIDELPRSSFAARAHVPLAQCEIALGHEDEAATVLREVLAGNRLLDPDAYAYRDALIELGRLHHSRGEFTAAIERLTEVSDRYPEDPRALEVLYLLADSYRSDALALDASLADAAILPPAERTRLVGLRTEHLQQAEAIFGRICDSEVGGSQESAHSAPAAGHPASFRDDLLRLAHLYRADCTFELHQYEVAVDLYERAARRYSGQHSSMYALVQIVNCYTAMGDGERAAAAHTRALLRLKQLPDQAFAGPEALLDRGAWERWLQNQPVGSVLPMPGGAMADEGS